MKTYEGFLAFVQSQPEDKPIVHAIWGKCAVGEYVNGYTSDAGPEHSLATAFAKEVLPEVVYTMLWQERPKTYGALVSKLSELGELE